MIEPVHLTPSTQPRSAVSPPDLSAPLLTCGLRQMSLATHSTLLSIEHVTHLLHVKTHSEAIKLSHDYYQAQMDILNGYTGCATNFIYESALRVAEPFRINAILPCSIVL